MLLPQSLIYYPRLIVIPNCHVIYYCIAYTGFIAYACRQQYHPIVIFIAIIISSQTALYDVSTAT